MGFDKGYKIPEHEVNIFISNEDEGL